MEENQKKFLIGLVIITLACSWLFFVNVYSPKAKAINKLKATLKSIDEEILAARSSTQIVIEKGVKDDKVIKDSLQKLIEKIPTEKEIPYLLNKFFSTVGTNQNIDYRLISPKALISKGTYLEFPIDVSFQSDYSDLNLFLKRLKELPSTIRINTLFITLSPDPTKLKIDMSLTAFVMPDQPQKELPKKNFGVSSVDPFALQVSEKKTNRHKTAGLYWA
jgi:Tfp pilus assembly protein PilO